MTFVELCQRTAREAGISGTGPSSVTGQTGQLGNVVNWVILAWKDIQNLPYDWKFLWTTSTATTIASNRDYDLSGDSIKKIDFDTVTAYKTATGVSDRQDLSFMEYQKFKSLLNRNASTPEGRPTIVTQLPNGNLRFYPTPDDIYTVEFDAYQDVQVLSDSNDTPLLPSRFHEIIVFKALLDHGRYEDAVEIKRDVPIRYERMLQDLKWDQIIDPSEDGHMVVYAQ